MVATQIRMVPVAERAKYVLGNDITSATSVSEAIEMAGLDWGLTIRDADFLTVTTDEGTFQTSIPGSRLVMRDDNHLTLGVVKSRYTKVENRPVFEIANYIENKTFRRAGEQDHGRKVFMELGLENSKISLLNGKDLLDVYVVIKAAHDGTGKVAGDLVIKRLACINGMTVNIKGLGHSFAIGHTASAEKRMHEAQVIMAGASKYAAAFTAAAERMLSIKMTLPEFMNYIDAIWPKPSEDDTKNAWTIWEKRRGELKYLFEFAETNNLGRHTAWAAFNSVTEHLDWAGSTRNHNKDTDSEEMVRARRQFDDTNAAVRNVAFEFALAA